MDKSALLDLALEKLVGDMDDLEGSAGLAHSAEECPDPLMCKMHDAENGDALSKIEGPGVEVEVKKIDGMPSLEGAKDADGDKDGDMAGGLAPDELEKLRELLK